MEILSSPLSFPTKRAKYWGIVLPLIYVLQKEYETYLLYYFQVLRFHPTRVGKTVVMSVSCPLAGGRDRDRDVVPVPAWPSFHFVCVEC